MPYINKRSLEYLVMCAFNEGIVTATAMDHQEGTPEQLFNSLDFDEFYNKHFKTKTKINAHFGDVEPKDDI